MKIIFYLIAFILSIKLIFSLKIQQTDKNMRNNFNEQETPPTNINDIQENKIKCNINNCIICSNDNADQCLECQVEFRLFNTKCFCKF